LVPELNGTIYKGIFSDISLLFSDRFENEAGKWILMFYLMFQFALQVQYIHANNGHIKECRLVGCGAM
jgi:hypothetical protein